MDRTWSEGSGGPLSAACTKVADIIKRESIFQDNSENQSNQIILQKINSLWRLLRFLTFSSDLSQALSVIEQIKEIFSLLGVPE